ncbi:CARDB domain-containing protein [Chroococcus sp. FPU101]|uniref:CARDB domain-containing protein n=1 Tax=Chroococcus sp. FPU101 TaxID=1974212 RepID=UPI001A8BFCA7|nr:CARDB domain-containing protein [Chroococcus sp. FPU101]GFE68311.1 hypothetical protein CFPU101_09210 [Chroococcus sp. FPU101]
MLSENVFPEPLTILDSLVNLVEPNPFNTNYAYNSSLANQFNNFNEINLEVNQLNTQSLWSNSPQVSQEQIDPLSVDLPDLIITGLNITSPIKAGNTVNFNYTLRNQGSVTASSIQTKYYLSNDSLLDRTDLELGDDNLSSLAKISSQIRTDSVNFSGNLNSGTYYFLVVTDSANTNVESDETNNTFVKEIRVTKPDLVVDPASITVPTNPVIAGQSMRVGYTARNQGDAGSSSGTTKYYLSTDMILDSSDSWLGNDTVASLSAGASTIRSGTVTLSSTLTSGTYYLLTQIDSTNTSLESNEANNVSSKAFSILEAPDLIVNTLNIPSSVAGGSSLNVSYTVENIGQSTASSHTTRFYLSTNTTYETTDIEIGSDSVVALSAGASLTKVKNMMISSSILDGNYYLLTRADTGNKVRESNETNNLFTSSAMIEITKPDLEISQFTLSTPNNPTVGSTLDVSYTLTNRGKVNAIGTTTKYYLSSNEFFDASDTYLGDDNVPTLAVGATLNRTDSFVLNTNLSSGTYYFLAIADSTNLVAESNENNNLDSEPIIASSNDQPDLVITPIIGNLVANQGENLNLSYTIENQGSVNAEPSTTKFYLSTDTTFDNSDVLLGSDSVASLASGTTRTQGVTLPISSNFNLGTYYLFAITDSEGVVTEIDENNNIVYQTLQITAPPQPDLLFDGLSIPNTVTQNSNLSVSYNIRNQGNADASATTTKFYLSTDTTLDNSDVALGIDNLAALVSGATSNKNLTLGLNNITPGTYYLLAQADSSDSLSESNENNNIISQMFGITEPPKPDLLIDTLVIPAQVNKGSNLVVVYNILNQGLASAASSTTKFYLSTDTTLGNDIYLGSDSVGTLASNQTTQKMHCWRLAIQLMQEPIICWLFQMTIM